MPGYRYCNKETFINKTEDINGCKPKTIFPQTNKIFFSLKNDDIKGKYRKKNLFEKEKTKLFNIY